MNRFVFILKLLVIVIILPFVLFQFSREALQQIFNWDTLIAIFSIQFFLFSATALNVIRYAFLVRKPPAPFTTCLAAILLSAGINLIIPGRVSEIIKATYVRKKLNIPLSNSTAAIVIERLLDVCVVATIGMIGFVGIFFEDVTMLNLMLIVSIIGLSLMKPVAKVIETHIRWRKDLISRFIHGNCEHVIKIISWKIGLITPLLTAFSWLLHCFAIWLFFFMLPGYQLSFTEATLVFGAIIFASAIPALPGGIGAIQAAIILVLTQLNVPVEEALLLSFAIHFAEILISAVSTPIILISQPTGMGDLVERALKFKKDDNSMDFS